MAAPTRNEPVPAGDALMTRRQVLARIGMGRTWLRDAVLARRFPQAGQPHVVIDPGEASGLLLTRALFRHGLAARDDSNTAQAAGAPSSAAVRQGQSGQASRLQKTRARGHANAASRREKAGETRQGEASIGEEWGSDDPTALLIASGLAALAVRLRQIGPRGTL